jgi:hypothetical protein
MGNFLENSVKILKFVVEDPTVAVKCRTAIQVLFLYFEFKAKN